jgi:hypothetical protein
MRKLIVALALIVSLATVALSHEKDTWVEDTIDKIYSETFPPKKTVVITTESGREIEVEIKERN